jgi:hypothetical protein
MAAFFVILVHMRSLLFSINSLILLCILTGSSCGEKSKKAEHKQVAKHLVLSKPVADLAEDTASYNPVVDSLKKVLKESPDTTQILLLNELSENWRPYS